MSPPRLVARWLALVAMTSGCGAPAPAASPEPSEPSSGSDAEGDDGASTCCNREAEYDWRDGERQEGYIVVSPDRRMQFFLPGQGWAASCYADGSIGAALGRAWNLTVKRLNVGGTSLDEEEVLANLYEGIIERLSARLPNFHVEHLEVTEGEDGRLLIFAATFNDEGGEPRLNGTFMRILRDEEQRWWLMYLTYEGDPHHEIAEEEFYGMSLPVLKSFTRASPGLCE
jgi:hypothetical protein